jgi:hypothetical protein
VQVTQNAWERKIKTSPAEVCISLQNGMAHLIDKLLRFFCDGLLESGYAFKLAVRINERAPDVDDC